MTGEIPKRLIGRAYELHEWQMEEDELEPCPINFMGGIAFAIGIITGSWDCGIPEGTPSAAVIQQLGREVHEHSEHLRMEMVKQKALKKKHGNRAERRRAGK